MSTACTRIVCIDAPLAGVLHIYFFHIHNFATIILCVLKSGIYTNAWTDREGWQGRERGADTMECIYCTLICMRNANCELATTSLVNASLSALNNGKWIRCTMKDGERRRRIERETGWISIVHSFENWFMKCTDAAEEKKWWQTTTLNSRLLYSRNSFFVCLNLRNQHSKPKLHLIFNFLIKYNLII